MRRLFVLVLAVSGSLLRADSPALTITQQLLPSPANVGATDPVFVPAADKLTISWREPDAAGRPQTFSANWETASARWSTPRSYGASSVSTDSRGEAPAPYVEFPDGSALSIFFPEKDGRILDLHTQRHHGNISAPSKSLSADTWAKDTVDPSNRQHPVLAAREARVVAVWLNHAGKSPRLFAAFSTNAGEQFFLPVRIDDGHPLGETSIVLLRDGSAYISWLEFSDAEKPAALWLRRLSAAGDPSVPVLIATAPSASAFGHPQIGLLKDYDASPGQLILAHPFAHDGVSQIVFRLITLPPIETFLQGRPCPACPPDSATLPGHPLKGRVVKILPQKQEVVIVHDEIPGILAAGESIFDCDEKTLTSLGKVTAILARIERRDGAWWLFDAKPFTTSSQH